MNHSFLLFIALILSANIYAADLSSIKKELKTLKELCDASLLDAEECKKQRAKILLTLDKKEEEIWFCNYGGENKLGEPILAEDGVSFSESSSVNTIVREILDEAGLVGNFIVRAASVPNAAASVRMGDRYIEYNPSFVQNLKVGTKTNWSVYSVLAHEIGHHLQGHTLKPGGSRPDIELQADEYSGFILAKMGASIKDAQKAMKTFGSDSASGTHPATQQRLVAIKKGWDKGKEPDDSKPQPIAQDHEAENKDVPPVTVQTPIQQPPAMPVSSYLYKCVVNGEQVLIDNTNRVLSVPRGGIQVGQRVPPNHPNCAFNLAAPPTGVYCVGHNGMVYFGTPMPVGQCIQCGPGQC
ncbi:hypothetical protein [Pseudoalteromonas rubra]|uniref:hypothetical protein n=1 Tax=Pseudoalteromonas rubra TaxID=43658 RepID=UPI0006969C52|nr:hypothetical protein [Pseudoalteromonas rubra]